LAGAAGKFQMDIDGVGLGGGVAAEGKKSQTKK
jgi:hypothetical protein